jgi:hypothetical protein
MSTSGKKLYVELLFAGFLDGCQDIVSFAKNYFAIGFRLIKKVA